MGVDYFHGEAAVFQYLATDTRLLSRLGGKGAVLGDRTEEINAAVVAPEARGGDKTPSKSPTAKTSDSNARRGGHVDLLTFVREHMRSGDERQAEIDAAVVAPEARGGDKIPSKSPTARSSDSNARKGGHVDLLTFVQEHMRSGDERQDDGASGSGSAGGTASMDENAADDDDEASSGDMTEADPVRCFMCHTLDPEYLSTNAVKTAPPVPVCSLECESSYLSKKGWTAKRKSDSPPALEPPAKKRAPTPPTERLEEIDAAVVAPEARGGDNAPKARKGKAPPKATRSTKITKKQAALNEAERQRKLSSFDNVWGKHNHAPGELKNVFIAVHD